MAFNLDSIKTDDTAATDGKWFTLTEDKDGKPDAQIKLRPIANTQWRKLARKQSGKNVGEVPLEVGDRRVRELLRKTVILDWKNFEQNGEPYEFTDVNVKRILMEQRFVDMVVGLAKIENFSEDDSDEGDGDRDADEKN